MVSIHSTADAEGVHRPRTTVRCVYGGASRISDQTVGHMSGSDGFGHVEVALLVDAREEKIRFQIELLSDSEEKTVGKCMVPSVQKTPGGMGTFSAGPCPKIFLSFLFKKNPVISRDPTGYKISRPS